MGMTPDGYTATQRFLIDHPDWIPIVRACVAVAEAYPRGDFPGARVCREAEKNGIPWFPNLRPLAAYGVLQRTEVSRGGRRAYYVMPDSEGTKKALQEAESSRA